jgi:hypothetical protein
MPITSYKKSIRINFLPSPAVAMLATAVNGFSVFVFSRADARSMEVGGNIRPGTGIQDLVHNLCLRHIAAS